MMFTRLGIQQTREPEILFMLSVQDQPKYGKEDSDMRSTCKRSGMHKPEKDSDVADANRVSSLRLERVDL